MKSDSFLTDYLPNEPRGPLSGSFIDFEGLLIIRISCQGYEDIDPESLRLLSRKKKDRSLLGWLE